MRIGYGYDIHRLVEGRCLVLGGVRFDHPLGLLGHSDADVLSHAIADALLGAAALGDIGIHFPPDDEGCKDMSSLLILRRVAELLRDEGWQANNVDATVVAEAPKIMPRASEMRKSIAEAIGVGTDRVSVKATTNEGLGSIGAREGICAHAVASIVRLSD